ncbi:annexin A7 isoform X2 [Mesocricetus auratus]|uniref:Annexin n=1 Tax=Mesocricetus auratus TaxID=10036 RepID=A0A1U8CJF3_MESAU|nr:annexin A7 isoform X2 [Mesocricetus auratus]
MYLSGPGSPSALSTGPEGARAAAASRVSQDPNTWSNEPCHLRGAGPARARGGPAAGFLAPPRRHALRPSPAPYCGRAGRAVTRLPGSECHTQAILLQGTHLSPDILLQVRSHLSLLRVSIPIPVAFHQWEEVLTHQHQVAATQELEATLHLEVIQPPGGYPVTPSPGGVPAYPGGQGFGAPPGGAGYPGYPQPPAQSYGGGPAQVPVPGGFPGGQMPSQYPGGQAPYPGQPAALTQGTQGTIRPASNFDAMRDAEILRKAMKGFGTDEQAIVDVVCSRSNDQRQQIKAAFKTMYGKDLIKDLKSELSGNMEELILALFMPSTYYDAWSLRKAMQGAGTQERVLIEILCTRTNQEIRDIVRCYQSEFGRDLEKDIKSDTSGHFERLLVSMCQGNRDENQSVNYQMAQDDAQRLYQAGEGKLGTDESCFNMILATRSFPQLKATMEAYSRMANRDLLSSVSREFSGYIESGLKTILQCALNRPAFFAERLYYSMKGAGTDDSTLVRIVVTRSEVDLVQIKQMFTQMYQKTLSTMIASDTSGDYRKLLLAIVGQ